MLLNLSNGCQLTCILDFFFDSDVLFSTGVMFIVCICERSCASSVCFVIPVQGLMENHHSRSSI